MMEKTQTENNNPPVMKSWFRLYTLVIINLVFWLSVFYLFRRMFE